MYDNKRRTKLPLGGRWNRMARKQWVMLELYHHAYSLDSSISSDVRRRCEMTAVYPDNSSLLLFGY